MRLRDILLTASANMFQSKLRTSLTIGAIFVGAFTLTLTNAIGQGVTSYVDKQVENMGPTNIITIMAKNDQNSNRSNEPIKYEPGDGESLTASNMMAGMKFLSSKDIDKIKTIEGLSDVRLMRSVSPDYIQGVNGEKYQLTLLPLGGRAELDLAAGEQVHESTGDNKIVLPLSYVKPLGFSSADDAVGKIIKIGITSALGDQSAVEAKIAGIQQVGVVSIDGGASNEPLTNELFEIQTTGLPPSAANRAMMATAVMANNLDRAQIDSIKTKLTNMGYEAQTPEDLLGSFKTVIDAITTVLNGFAIIALLAASFGIVNTLLMSVQERTRSIGLMKAMGMKNGGIFLLFSTEAVLIGFWGSFLGALMGIGVGTLINSILSKGLLKDLPGLELFAFSPIAVLSIMLLIMSIAFLAGTLPARKAAKLNPIDALRYE